MAKHRHATGKRHHKSARHHGLRQTTLPQGASAPAPQSGATATTSGGDSGAPGSASTAGGQPPSGPCANSSLIPDQGNLGLVRDATLCLVNQLRAEHGVAALRVNATLAQIAQPYALKMVAENFFAHVTPGGQTPLARFLLSGYIPGIVTYSVGENIGWGTGSLSTPAAVVAGWVHSPEHFANILNANFRDTGMGVAPAAPASLANGQAGATYDQEFGSVLL